MTYEEFIKQKQVFAETVGFEVADSEIHPLLKPHQRDCVRWALRGGRRALFEAFGLGKTVQTLEILRLILHKLGNGRALVVAPLGVRQEFKRDAEMLGLQITFIRRTEEIGGVGTELNHQYFVDAAYYCKSAELEINTPTLFELIEEEEKEIAVGV